MRTLNGALVSISASPPITKAAGDETMFLLSMIRSAVVLALSTKYGQTQRPYTSPKYLSERQRLEIDTLLLVCGGSIA